MSLEQNVTAKTISSGSESLPLVSHTSLTSLQLQLLLTQAKSKSISNHVLGHETLTSASVPSFSPIFDQQWLPARF